ncbi:MAG: hypothetical protein JWL59_194 [Chthoniobacteraceae bacterium]|nr:hypothetical protein [Chthoniobacteraceae bacterium]
MKTSPVISRRTMLKGLGACLALPLLETMRPLRGFAAEAPLPIRMAILYMANGVRPDAWTPAALGRDFELSPILSPLAPFKDDLLVLSELWNAASDTGDGHYVKTGGFLTGTTITRTTGANLSSNGVSMDQLCARRIGNFTALPSLELGLEPPATGVDANVGYTQLYGAHISWNTPTTPLPKEINPRLAFDRLFRPKGVPGDRATAATRDKSVLDLVSEEAKSLQRKLGVADREKLSEYMESVRSVERRIEWDADRQKSTILGDPLALKEVESLGKRVDAYSDPSRVSERRGDPNEHVHLMLDLVALAFWTDATRIATFMFGNAVSGRSFAFLGGGIGGHHQTSHHENKADKMDQYQRINTWHIEKYAYLLGKLKGIREGEGTLLDRSMILLGAGMRDGNAHNPHNLPILLAGRAGGTLATGRHISYAKNTPLSGLYRSMLTRMGTPVDHFADSTGELPGLDDQNFTGRPA